MEFEKKVGDFIQTNQLFKPDGRILLAVSGGADSIALLYCLCSLRDEGVLGGELICAHINHQLREGDAKLDEDFVCLLYTSPSPRD